MRNSDDSWWLKVKRAQKHRDDLERRLAPYEIVRPYEIRESFDRQAKRYVYSAWIDRAAVPVDPQIAILMGDFLVNLRAALDHMRVALVPNSRKGKGYFPIFTEDFTERCPTCGLKKPNAEREAERFASFVKGMDQMAIDYILARQPFQTGGDPTVLAERSVLSVLNALANADKHRQLVTLASGIRLHEVRVTEPDGTMTIATVTDHAAMRLGEDGAHVHVSPHKVKVEAEGTVVVAVRGGAEGDRLSLPDICDHMLQWIGGEILPALDMFTPS